MSDMHVGVTEARMVGDLVAALKQASGACSCMVYDHNDPRWMVMREALEMTTDVVSRTVVFPTIKKELIV